jgi:hypothetical protein
MRMPSASRFAVLLAVGGLVAACPAPSGEGEGEGEAGEGEGEAGEGEGEEGEGEEGEGEGEGEEPVEGFDVTLDVAPLEPSLVTRYRTFAADACEVDGGCVDVAGNRALLSVDLVLRNAGTVLVPGPTVANGTCGVDVKAGLITARLVARDGTVALEHDLDIAAFDDVAVGNTVTLTPGPCALLDITDVAPGDYALELALHADLLGDDVRPSNDVVSVDVVVVNGLECPSNANVCGGVCCPQNTGCVDDACALPDLFVDEQALFDTLQVQESTFSEDSCAIVEGCVDAAGNRRLLRFSTTTPNDGNADLVMGRPLDRPDLFTFSDCHGHFHFDQYANYRLLDAAGNVVSTGHKQAFCLIDLERRDPDARRRGQFGCSVDGTVPQGISKGWADTYNSQLDCQWIDITGVAEGNYVLEVHVNPDHIFPELDLMNNVARVPVFVPADPNACVPNPNGEVCHNGEDDDCNELIDDGCAPIADADACDNGFTIDGDGLVVGEILAGNESDSAPSCGGAGGEFVVHFNVASDSLLYLSTYGSAIDTTLSVYRGADCATADEVLCVDDGCVDHGGAGGAHILEEMTGSAYTAVIKAKNAGDIGLVQLKIELAGCIASVLADAGNDGDVIGDIDDGRDNTSPSCQGDCASGGNDTFWAFATCPGDSTVRVTTCGAGVAEGENGPGTDQTFFDTLLEFREGGCLGDPVPGTCNDDVRTGQIRCSEVETTLRGNGAGDGLWFALVDDCNPEGAGRSGGYELHLEQ